MPPLPRKSKAKAQAKAKEAPANEKIPVSSLKLLEAELGHVVSLGDKPLTVQAVETRIAEAKPAGKSLDAFIVRYGTNAPPARVAAKAKMAAAILRDLHF